MFQIKHVCDWYILKALKIGQAQGYATEADLINCVRFFWYDTHDLSPNLH